MTGPSGKRRIPAVILIVAVVMVAAAALLLAVPAVSPRHSTSVTCIQSGIHGGLLVRVVADGTSSPIQGANVTATIMNYCDSDTNLVLDTTQTNSSGYAGVPSGGWVGSYSVHVAFLGKSYTFPASVGAGTWAVTVSVPSGTTTETLISCEGPGCPS